MEIVSKAKSAFQAVSAKAERVISDIKADANGFIVSISGNSGSPSSYAPQGRAGDPPWVGKTEQEKLYEIELKERMLEISKSPDIFIRKDADEILNIDLRTAMPSAAAALEEDESLRNLRAELVPKKVKEHDFWRRYFTAVKRIRQEVLPREDSAISATDASLSDCSESTVQSVSSSPLRVETDALEEEAYESAYRSVAIASSRVVRRLAAAVGVARGVRTIIDLATPEDNSPLSTEQVQVVAEKLTASIKHSVGAGIAALGSLSVREKDKNKEKEKEKERQKEMKKYTGECHPLLWSLFEADTQYVEARDKESTWKPIRTAEESFIEDIHGAPPDSFVPQLAEIMAGIKSEQKMAIFWQEVVKELRQRWLEGTPIPRLPPEANPDMHTCLLNQQLQLVNCCIARRKRRESALADLELVEKLPLPTSYYSSAIESSQDSCKHVEENSKEAANNNPLLQMEMETENGGGESPPFLVTKLADGSLAKRLGVANPVPSLKLLDTGEPLCAPLCQDGPVLTEDFVRETEELIMRTGSVGTGCSQLFSDMQAFKAANPGAIIEDFVRWYSPPDWASEQYDAEGTPASNSASVEEQEGNAQADSCSQVSPNSNGAEGLTMKTARGFLSTRMQAEGNLWKELWQSAKAVPAARQAPLFDEELLGESTLDALENIAPSDLFEQLFIAALGAGFAIAISAPQAKHEPFATCLEECSSYVTSTCTRGMSAAKLERLCQVYEVMETAVHTPPEGQNSSPNLWNSLAFVRHEGNSRSSSGRFEGFQLPRIGFGISRLSESDGKEIPEGDSEEQPTRQAENALKKTKGNEETESSSNGDSDKRIDILRLLNIRGAGRSARGSEADKPRMAEHEGEWMLL